MSTASCPVSPRFEPMFPSERDWEDVGSHATPLGTLWSHWTDRGLARLHWQTAKVDAEFTSRGPALGAAGPAAEFDRRLQAFFAGDFEALQAVELDSSGWTPFFAEVYHACRSIPAGQTRRYAELAEAAGRPRAVRAVGQAMARNRVPLVIPCHRVVGSDGRLCGFSAPGGLETKRKLLDLESAVSVATPFHNEPRR